MLLRDIVKQVQHLEMKLMAGEAGLNNEVVWTHMVDDTVSAFAGQGWYSPRTA
ncbi:MAG: hypothetical protein ACLSF2_02590 [Butyricicoccus sp.]